RSRSSRCHPPGFRLARPSRAADVGARRLASTRSPNAQTEAYKPSRVQGFALPAACRTAGSASKENHASDAIPAGSDQAIDSSDRRVGHRQERRPVLLVAAEKGEWGPEFRRPATGNFFQRYLLKRTGDSPIRVTPRVLHYASAHFSRCLAV